MVQRSFTPGILRLQTTGTQALAEELAKMPKTIKSKALRGAVQGAMKPVRKNGRSMYSSTAKIRTGALRQSLGSTRPRRLSRGALYSIYKPRPTYTGTKNVRKAAAKISVRTKRGPEKGNIGTNIKPYKYAHLVEFGTFRSRAFPFMRNAFRRSQAQIKKGAHEGAEKVIMKAMVAMAAKVNGSKKP